MCGIQALMLLLPIASLSASGGSGAQFEASAQEATVGRLTLATLDDDGFTVIERSDWGVSFFRVASPGDALDSALRELRIHPDGEALDFVYRLNDLTTGSIQDLDTVELPTFSVRGEPSSDPLYLTLDLEAKQELAALTDGASTSVGRFCAARTPVADPCRNLRSYLESVETLRDAIRARVRPVDYLVIAQVTQEVGQLLDLLGHVETGLESWDDENLTALELMATDSHLRLRPVRETMGPASLPGPWPQVQVVVRTVSSNGVRVNDLRVKAVPRALWNKRSEAAIPFEMLSSPTTRRLPFANYYLWAEEPATGADVTERFNFVGPTDSSTDSVTVEIVVIRRREG